MQTNFVHNRGNNILLWAKIDIYPFVTFQLIKIIYLQLCLE